MPVTLNDIAKAALAYRRTKNKYDKVFGTVEQVTDADERIRKARLKLTAVMAKAKKQRISKLQIETAIQHGDNVAAGIDYPNWKD